MEVWDINRGIRAYTAKSNRFCSCGLSVLFKRELNKDEVTKNALLVNILGLGCKEYPTPSALAKAAALSFGSGIDCVNMKKGNFQLLEFYTCCVNEEDNVKNALELLKKVIFEPLTENNAFKEEYLKTAKEMLKSSIRSRKDDKKEYARERLLEEMFAGQGAGIPGDGFIDDVEPITCEALYAHYKKVVSQSEIIITSVGSFDGEALKRGLRAFDVGGREPKTTVVKSKQTSGKPKEVYENMEVSQSKLGVGLKTKADYYELLCANEIFGGGSQSRLFMKAREKEVLCYYITSQVLRGLDRCVLQCGVSEENADKIIDIINSELADMKNTTDAEIERAKEGLVKQYTELSDSLSAVESFCLSKALWGGADSPEEALKIIKSLKNDSIRAAFEGASVDTIYLLRRGEATP
ncbi:MAG: insulinase family protein [Clostridiales bacterium]|nr:insulinase family protein [Clostridiales bacterium]